MANVQVVKDPSHKRQYALRFDFDWALVKVCQDLKATHGWEVFAFDKGAWRFANVSFVETLRPAFPGLSVSPEVERDMVAANSFKAEDERRKVRAMEIKSRLTSDFEVRGIKGELYNYQKVGVEFLVNSGGRAIVADAPGIGKTSQALGYISHEKISKTLVVCPATAKSVWKKEVAKWTKLKTNVIESSDQLSIDVWNSADIHVISYNSVKKFFPILKALKIDALVCDESHRCLPGSAMVATLYGWRRIDSVVNSKDTVFVASFNQESGVVEYREVISRSRQPLSNNLVVVKHTYGYFTCTQNHRVWTDSGYEEASSLSEGDTLRVLWGGEVGPEQGEDYSEVLQQEVQHDGEVLTPGGETGPKQEATETVTGEEVSCVRRGFSVPDAGGEEKQQAVFLWKYVRGKVAHVIAGQKRPITEDDEVMAGTYAVKRGAVGVREGQENPLGEDEGDEQRPSFSTQSRSGGAGVAEEKPYVLAQGRERETYQRADKTMLSSGVPGRVDGVCYPNVARPEQVSEPPHCLQGGLGVSPGEVGYRGRREEPPHEKVEVLGRTENICLGVSRVESVTFLEQGDKQQPGEGCGGDTDVYNLEVEGNHNYFTDGVLVANCKEPSTTWTKLITSLSRGIPKFIALTGTPVLSRPKELFTTLNMISPHEFPDPWAFYKRYCDPKKTRWGWEFKGSSNVEELKDRIATHYIRRTKGQVLPYLPAKVRVDHEVPLDKETAKEYRLAEADFVRYLEKSKDTKTNVATVLTQLNELRRLASIGKIDGAIDLVDDLVESGEKVIVFSAFNEPLKELKNYFGDKAVMIIGETTTKDREAAVGRFQEDDTVRVFLGGLRSSGEGITLTKGSSTVFLDYSWVPAEQEQAENRNHRPGVEHQSVTIYQLYTEGTIDDKMRCVNESKKELFEKLFGDGGKASDELVNGVIDSYRKGL